MKTNKKVEAAYGEAMAAMDALHAANMALFEATDVAKTQGTFNAEAAEKARQAVIDANEYRIAAYGKWDAAEAELHAEECTNQEAALHGRECLASSSRSRDGGWQ